MSKAHGRPVAVRKAPAARSHSIAAALAAAAAAPPPVAPQVQAELAPAPAPEPPAAPVAASAPPPAGAAPAAAPAEAPAGPFAAACGSPFADAPARGFPLSLGARGSCSGGGSYCAAPFAAAAAAATCCLAADDPRQLKLPAAAAQAARRRAARAVRHDGCKLAVQVCAEPVGGLQRVEQLQVGGAAKVAALRLGVGSGGEAWGWVRGGLLGAGLQSAVACPRRNVPAPSTFGSWPVSAPAIRTHNPHLLPHPPT